MNSHYGLNLESTKLAQSIPLDRVICQENPLVQLYIEFDWKEIRRDMAVKFCDTN
jgi:hypothetical protein